MGKQKKTFKSGHHHASQVSVTIQQRLVQGLALHQKGELSQAKAIYEAVLKQYPRHFDALHFSGVLAYQMQEHERAIALLNQAIEINPTNAPAYYNLGIVWQDIKQFDAAIQSYKKAIELNPGHASAYYNMGTIRQELREFDLALQNYDHAVQLKADYAAAYGNRGIVLQEQKQYLAARESYDKAIALKADYVEAYSNRSMALKELGCLDEALQSCEHAIALNPDYAKAHNNRGIVLKELEFFNEALQSCEQAIALKPDYAEAYGNRGIVLHKLKRYEAALESCDKAIALKPDFVEAYNSKGAALNELKQHEAALQCYEKAISLKPDFAGTYNGRGLTFHNLGQYDLALQDYDHAIALKPDFADAYCHCGVVLQNLGQFDASLKSYSPAIQIEADHSLAHWNKSLLNLLLGNFADGWQGYEWRWENKEIGVFKLKREFDGPRWTGNEPLSGKTIFLYAEQGLGDSIQFCRYAKLLAGQGARVILEVQPSLVLLLKNLEGVSQVIPQGHTLPEFDYHCPLLSLPLAFKTRLSSIPKPEKYLHSDETKVRAWSARLGAKTKPRIGIVWSGNPGHKNDFNRSIPLSDFAHILPDDCDCIVLQKDIREADRAVLKAHPERLDLSGELDDFTDTAALCELMDIIIGVDTSVVHLAAALGKPTWILLSRVPDWRWLLDREDSPWYPTAKLYRQKEAGNWPEVLERVKADLGREIILKQ